MTTFITYPHYVGYSYSQSRNSGYIIYSLPIYIHLGASLVIGVFIKTDAFQIVKCFCCERGCYPTILLVAFPFGRVIPQLHSYTLGVTSYTPKTKSAQKKKKNYQIFYPIQFKIIQSECMEVQPYPVPKHVACSVSIRPNYWKYNSSNAPKLAKLSAT